MIVYVCSSLLILTCIYWSEVFYSEEIFVRKYCSIWLNSACDSPSTLYTVLSSMQEVDIVGSNLLYVCFIKTGQQYSAKQDVNTVEL